MIHTHRNNCNLELGDNDGDRAIHLAAYADKPDVIECLVEAKANVNAKNKQGQTALHVAINEGFKGTVKTLLEQGADTSAKVCYEIRFGQIVSQII